MNSKLKHMLLMIPALTLSCSCFAAVCDPQREFDEIAATVTKNFVDQTFRGLDWPGRVAVYRDEISCSDGDVKVATVVNRLLAELHTSHTSLFTRRDLDFWALSSIFSGNLRAFPVAFAGIWPVKIENNWFVRSVLEGSKAESAGVRVGDQLLGIDNEVYSPMGWTKGKTSALRYSHDGATEHILRIKPSWESAQSAFVKATAASHRIIEHDGKRVGYIHVWCGTHEAFLSLLNQSLKVFGRKKVDAIVIDLRDGFGGASLDYLKEITQNPSLRGIKKALLINDGVRSGKEWVTGVFKKERLGWLIGSKTAGAFVGGKPFRLFGDKYLLYLAVAEFVPEGIGPIEGVGITPDIEVAPCKQFCGIQDFQLDSALRELTK